MHVYLLVDRSGSMGGIWNEAIGSINGYVEKLPEDTHIQINLFDTVSHDVIRNSSKVEYKPIGSYEYQPRGGTPLYDAFGDLASTCRTINDPTSVIVVMTDGEENSSKKYTQGSVKDIIKDFEDNHKWPVIFLGANFDRAAVQRAYGATMGVSTMSYSRGMATGGMSAGMSHLADQTSDYAATGSTLSFSVDDKGN